MHTNLPHGIVWFDVSLLRSIEKLSLIDRVLSVIGLVKRERNICVLDSGHPGYLINYKYVSTDKLGVCGGVYPVCKL